MSSGIALLERAAHVARQYGELPERTDALMGVIGLVAIQIMKSSPDDHAELLEQIARAARK